MVEDRDVRDLLNTGVWTTQRAKSPRPSDTARPDQIFRLDSLEPNDSARIPRTFTHLSHTPFPPPPSVEDEGESLARESNGSVLSLNDEEPKCKGTVDQFPIILPVPEANAERRFVLVAQPHSDEELEVLLDDSGRRKPTSSVDTEYTATSKPPPDLKPDRDELPHLQKRKSRTDLPRLNTDSRDHIQPRPSPHAHRSRSATCVDQGHRDASPRDYFSARPEPVRRTGEAFLTPVIKHTTKGRDRAYWDFSTDGDGSSFKDPPLQQKPQSADRRGLDGYARPSHTAGPGAHRRLHTDTELPRLNTTGERLTLDKDEAQSWANNGPLSPSLDRRRSPPKLARRETSPARPRADPFRPSRSRSSYHGRSSSKKEAVPEYSSDEDHDHKTRRHHHHHHHHRERMKSTVIHEDRSAFLSPDRPRPPTAYQPRSKPPSPLPSPKLSQEKSSDYKWQPDPRSSADFHAAKDKRRSEIQRPLSPTSPGTSSSPRNRSRLRADDRASDLGRPRASSRTPSVKSNASSSKPVNPPLYSSTTTALPMAVPSDDRKRQTMPPTPTWSRQSSMEAAPPQPTTSYWRQDDNTHAQHQMASPSPRHSGTSLEQPGPPVISYRRYSQDVSAGTLPGLPDCPRKRPRSGYVDWYTLPRCDNFNICPSCYEQVFYPTTFRDLFIPASSTRPRDRDRDRDRDRNRETACALGTSPWYRIAWLMTQKYRRTDLRLLQGISDVAARHSKTPCYGPVRATRIWHSLLDPDTRRCISNFRVCKPCAESVQVLFPSLTGVFVVVQAVPPPDRRPTEQQQQQQQVPRPGQCSLHFAPGRTRFLTYLDIFEDTHDRAVAKTNAAPDMQRLVERIDSWAGVEECPRDEPQRSASWYTMAHVPEMTVCEECFLDVVYPELVVDASAMASGGAAAAGAREGGQAENAVVRNFYHKPQLIKTATVCQMARPGMRDLFWRACRRDDGLAYLYSKVQHSLGSM